MSKVELLQGVKPKKVVKYMVLPGIIPRIRDFFGSGFQWLAVLMAVIYSSVRLLPKNHAYLDPANKGRFGIRHVIAEAANNLVIKRENADQIIVFFALLMGFVILCVQFAMLIFGFIISPAFAAFPGFGAYAGIFETPGCVASGSACPDIAFMLLDKVFAIPDLYNSRFAPAGAGAIPPFNRALQLLFNYYNLAMLLVGVIIFLYYVIVMVAETAQSGTPFGRRFNHVYAPLRLVVAIGFLVPINYGLNSAQYITLFAAKYGSGMATNGWITFNNALPGAVTPIGTSGESLVARPRAPDTKYLLTFMSVVKACAVAYETQFPAGAGAIDIEPYLVRNNPLPDNDTLTSYAAALTFYDNNDIIIRFGQDVSGATTPMRFKGDVDPICGEIRVHVNDVTQIGANRIQQEYFRAVRTLWNNTQLLRLAERATAMENIGPDDPEDITGFVAGDDDPTQLPSIEWKRLQIDALQGSMEARVITVYNQMVTGTDFAVPAEVIEHGWGGAGIWYNSIAEWNGSFFSAALNVPSPNLMPFVMEKIQEEKRTNDEGVTTQDQFEPVLASGAPITFERQHDEKIALVLNRVYKYWTVDGPMADGDTSTSGNVFFDTMNALLGIGGLFEMRQNDDIHPLAQLTGIGRSIVESSIRNLMTALVFSAGGGMAEVMNQHLGSALHSISGIFVSLTTIGLAIGFILYYVLPFLPFIYFFFAVGGWVKSIFEAMVGVPLWALAHLRVDGNGFPGDSASNGYFLIFEIFVRPILTVFGLIAGLAIFSAMARTLNGVFDLLIVNMSGSGCVVPGGGGSLTFGDCSDPGAINLDEKRGVVDEFFYTIIYTIIVYLLATSSFKLIDQIPNSILRWAGAGVQSFGDNRDDPTQGLVQYAAFGGANMAGQVSGALTEGARAGGMAVGGVGRGLFGLVNRSGPAAGGN